MKLIIIRPQPGADATAKRATALGIKTTVASLFEVRPVEWALAATRHYDALMITSANALTCGGPALGHLRDLPVLAVGKATAEHAKSSGFKIAVTGNSGVADLLEMTEAQGFRNILWLTGRDHIDITPPALVKLDRVVVYEACALPPPDTLVAELSNPAVTALHSPRAARIFNQLCDDLDIDKAQQSLVTLSPAIAQVAGNGWRAVCMADQPNDKALLSAALSFFTNAHSDP
jgi:uroporphyrinogen-III synthase